MGWLARGLFAFFFCLHWVLLLRPAAIKTRNCETNMVEYTYDEAKKENCDTQTQKITVRSTTCDSGCDYFSFF